MAIRYTDKSLLKLQCEEDIDDETLPDVHSLNLEVKLNDILEKRLSILRKPRIELDKNLSHGILLENECCVKLTKIKGKFIHYMGHTSYHGSPSGKNDNQQNVILHPEEALFLIENSALQIFSENQLPISIQEAYAAFINRNSDLKLESYVVYSFLSRLGYIVTRSRFALQEQSLTQEFVNTTKVHSEDSLLKPDDWKTMNSSQMFNKINIVKSYSIDDLKKRLKKREQSRFKTTYDVYLPDKKFKKTNPGLPVYRICLYNISPVNTRLIVPKIGDLVVNYDQNTKLLFTFFDNGSLLFYNFTSVKLPTVYDQE